MPAEQVDRQPRGTQRGPRILREGVIENLVAQGRIPQLHEMQEGIGKATRKITVCFVPPEGTQIGDTEIWLSAYGPGYKSHAGEFRGRAEDVGTLSPSQARSVRKRIGAAKASL